MKKIIAWLLEPFYFKSLLPYLGGIGFILYGGKGDSDPPDYTPVAEASAEAARIASKLGREQLAEAKRQYDNNMAVAQPIVNSQAALANQTIAQGDDYFNYMKQYSRPVEQSLYYESMGFTPDEIAQIEASRTREVTAFKDQTTQPVPVSYQVPTYEMQPDIPDGAVKGNEVGNITVPNPNPKPSPSMGNLGALAAWSPTITQKADPNSYYVKNADGTYKQVTIGQKVIEGTKTINQSVPQDASKLIQSTPETDALQAQLGAAASARMKAADAAERQKITDLNTNLATRIGESDVDVYLRNKASIDEETAQAVADARSGFSSTANMIAREGMRYGFSPNKIAAAVAGTGTDQATKTAQAANATRKNATNTMYQRGIGESGQLLTGGMTDRNNKIQDESLATGKKLDVAGLYRGLPGASQGAYNVSIGAGNSAVTNNAQAGNSLIANSNSAANTILQGQQQKLSGLTSILGNQVSQSNNQDDGSAIWGALGTIGGAFIGGPAGAAVGGSIGGSMSDKKVKKNIKKVDDDKSLEGIKKTEVSEWQYDDKKVKGQDNKKHIGAMAQDVKKNMGKQSSNGEMVDLISMVGVNMSATRALAKKVEKLEGKKK